MLPVLREVFERTVFTHADDMIQKESFKDWQIVGDNERILSGNKG